LVLPIGLIHTIQLHGASFIHERGLVHLDIKIENILLVNEGRKAKICDFGLTCAVGRKSTGVGTTSSMAPELVTVNHHKVQWSVLSSSRPTGQCAH
jgi:serine/threonine protein kinase